MFEYENTFNTGSFTCDFCEIESGAIDDTFNGCIEEIKEYGWIISKYDNEWLHFCSRECKQKFFENLKGKR